MAVNLALIFLLEKYTDTDFKSVFIPLVGETVFSEINPGSIATFWDTNIEYPKSAPK
ncbi:MAG: hypothetical protein V8R52_09820 [Coprobacter fastidiosus]